MIDVRLRRHGQQLAGERHRRRLVLFDVVRRRHRRKTSVEAFEDTDDETLKWRRFRHLNSSDGVVFDGDIVRHRVGGGVAAGRTGELLLDKSNTL